MAESDLTCVKRSRLLLAGLILSHPHKAGNGRSGSLDCPQEALSRPGLSVPSGPPPCLAFRPGVRVTLGSICPLMPNARVGPRGFKSHHHKTGGAPTPPSSKDLKGKGPLHGSLKTLSGCLKTLRLMLLPQRFPTRPAAKVGDRGHELDRGRVSFASFFCYTVYFGQICWACFTTKIQSSVQFSSVAQSCPTLCDPMDRSTPGLPVHPQVLELTQTHPLSR